jgi:hypothetical protein
MPAKKSKKKGSAKSVKTLDELEAEGLFRGYKELLIERFGRGPMADDVLNTFGQWAFGDTWGGAMGQDSVPTPLPRDKYYVVSTSKTPNSPGVHWMGMRVTQSGTGYVYDSFARSSAKLLPELRSRRKKGAAALKDADRKDAEQRGASAVCGQLSLAWLLVARDLGVKRAALI